MCADLGAEGEMQDRLSRANQPGHESAHAEMLARGFLVRLSADSTESYRKGVSI